MYLGIKYIRKSFYQILTRPLSFCNFLPKTTRRRNGKKEATITTNKNLIEIMEKKIEKVIKDI